MSSIIGENIRLSLFGESHSQAIGMTLDGVPAGIHVDPEVLQSFLNRRAPGTNCLAYLWPIVREMIKTAIENNQNLIVEGCYIPLDWRQDFDEQ